MVLVGTLVAGFITAVSLGGGIGKKHYVAIFDNSNGIFAGDEVLILGVPVGEIESIEPRPDGAKIEFWVDDQYKIPADAKALIISPQLVTARAIQLTPVYEGGPELQENSVIPKERTAVPVEWDDFRQQLEKLTESLQPTEPGGLSPLGSYIETVADNLRGQGPDIRETVIALSEAISALGDRSDDMFSTMKNLSTLVSALHSSTELLSRFNVNMANVTTLLANDPDEVDRVVNDINTAAAKVRQFVADNREALGTSTDKLASISTAVTESMDDIKQALHVTPNAFQNFVNIFQPTQGAITGAIAMTNFNNPLQFICSAIQAASRLGAEQSAKLCVQYLAPIFKNRQYNFLPLGINPVVGVGARPNEITYSEDWLRPDYNYRAAQQQPQPQAPAEAAPPAAGEPLAAEAPQPEPPAAEPHHVDPAEGLEGLMTPPGAGS
ncbi:hypothetical protein MPHL43072_02255 [Mycolicibacterium phlei DSM 43072]|uniref:Mammalian cell entry protein n=1 Tax=Mycolicibacterium phlei DSM 43239 = CCUG 21000 TaxID=1226750 RepID=A0A5N5V0U4_MYCPH|nr:mammalian cell entry protein [Mycolicibacterium phlei DSM 43239 = CCUG 21000]KXW65402.1 mammalian cell entry protein [Mycolicibacterium phlei DSM 43239 = CCUG 21000]KXW69482.1 hypothetical protein MPHL43070_18665 [Mycolicibacterium phlei DSM 43070]KXW72626.1 hypothetical protein MPHL43072_02255 [Mycolicibacterium phlei DSM 43072]